MQYVHFTRGVDWERSKTSVVRGAGTGGVGTRGGVTGGGRTTICSSWGVRAKSGIKIFKNTRSMKKRECQTLGGGEKLLVGSQEIKQARTRQRWASHWCRVVGMLAILFVRSEEMAPFHVR